MSLFQWFLDRIEKLPRFTISQEGNKRMQGRKRRNGNLEIEIFFTDRVVSWEMDEDTAALFGKWIVNNYGGIPDNVISMEHRIVTKD